MNKKFVYVLLVVMTINLFIINGSDIVKADSNYSLDYGWENEDAGDTSGVSGFFEYEEVAPHINQEFRVSASNPYNGLRSFEVKSDASDNDLGYWNLSSSFDYISSINFTVHATDLGTGGELSMNFYNSSGEVLEIVFDDGDGDIEYLDYADVEQNLCNYGVANGVTARLHFLITHTSSNTMRYQVFNDTWVELCDVTGTSTYTATWTSFDYIKFECSNTPESTLYFDDFNITTTGGMYEYDFCSGQDEYDNNIYIYKLFNNSVGYWNETLTFRWVRFNTWLYDIQIVNADSDVVFSFQSGQPAKQFDWIPRQNDGIGTFYIRMRRTNGDGTWEVNCPFSILSNTIQQGDWAVWTDSTIYNEGDNVKVNYVIEDGQLGSIDYHIRQADGEYEVYSQFEDLEGDGNTHSFTLTNVGNEGAKYYLYLFNSTDAIELMSTYEFDVRTANIEVELLVNNDYTATVNSGDEVMIRYKALGIHDDFYIGIYNDTTFNSSNLVDLISIGSNNVNDVYRWTAKNLSVGNELFYVALHGVDTGLLIGHNDSGLYNDGIFRVITAKDRPVGWDGGSGDWYGLPFWTPFLIGIFLTLIVTMSPLIIAVYINRRVKTNLHIPSLLYVGFFFMGLITSVVIGFLPSWLPFVILFGMVVYFAVQWLYGSKEVAGE